MDLLSAAERLAAIDRSAVTLESARCLHSADRFSECTACFELCPLQAIRPGKPPELDAERCDRCLACLPACPVGAYSADDSFAAVLNSAARLETRAVELVCARHTAPERGLPEATALRVHGCLAGLGLGALLSLAALGLDQVALRLDECAACPWSTLPPRAEALAAEAAQWLDLLGQPAAVVALTAPQAGWAARPLWDAQNPPLSRRDLFRVASRQGQVAAARAMTQSAAGSGPRLARERQRLLGALVHLHGVSFRPGGTLAGLGFAGLAVSEACTACGVCARACPSAALVFDRPDEQHYRLLFKPAACTGCQVCQHVCAPDAITVQTGPSLPSVFSNDGPVELRSGELVRCDRCGAPTAARPDSKLCPACEFRVRNPFGSMLPPGFGGRDRGAHPGPQASDNPQPGDPDDR